MQLLTEEVSKIDGRLKQIAIQVLGIMEEEIRMRCLREINL